MSPADEQVELGMLDNHAVFGVGDVWLTTRRIDGQFPNYRQLMPETFEHEVRLPRDELLDVVRRAAVMAQRNSPLRLRFADGELTISAQTQDVGESNETLPVPFTGEPFEIGFNAEFLRDGIESARDRRARAEADQPTSARSDRGRRRGLLVPDHADPARGLIVTAVRSRFATSGRTASSSCRFAAGWCSSRAERGGQDEPARGAACRNAGFLASHAVRRAARPVRAEAARIALRGRTGTAPVEIRVDLSHRGRKGGHRERHATSVRRATAHEDHTRLSSRRTGWRS